VTTGVRTTWLGLVSRDGYDASTVAARDRVADAAGDGDWPALFRELDASAQPDWVNASRLGGQTAFAPLHQAAWHGAPREVVEQLLSRGAWRTARTARRERPVDLADARGHAHLLDLLRPVVRHPVAPDTLAALERLLRPLLAEVSRGLTENPAVRPPELEILTELPEGRLWFPIPGMYGGADLRLDAAGPALVVESWSRVVEGSGRRHRVTPEGTVLLEEGFV
jgi:hypothetical protein